MTGFDLEGTAKALAQPVSKLIEAVSTGCGRIYEPTAIRRRAKAEAAALVIGAAAKEEVTDLQLRAATRRLFSDERKQANMDAIVAGAADNLEQLECISSDPVDPDWIVRFFAECEDIGDKEIQSIWSGILSGEVKRPGTFSVRTLSVLKNLSKVEAELFNTLCKNSFRTIDKSTSFPFYTEMWKDFWKSKGVGFSKIMMLNAAGLVTYHTNSLSYGPDTEYVFLGSEESLYFHSETSKQMDIGRVALTVAGEEIATICEWDTSERTTLGHLFADPDFEFRLIRDLKLRTDGKLQFEVILPAGEH